MNEMFLVLWRAWDDGKLFYIFLIHVCCWSCWCCWRLWRRHFRNFVTNFPSLSGAHYLIILNNWKTSLNYSKKRTRLPTGSCHGCYKERSFVSYHNRVTTFHPVWHSTLLGSSFFAKAIDVCSFKMLHFPKVLLMTY